MKLELANTRVYHITELDSFVDTPWVKSFCEHLRKDGYTCFNPLAYLFLNIDSLPVHIEDTNTFKMQYGLNKFIPFLPLANLTDTRINKIFNFYNTVMPNYPFIFEYAVPENTLNTPLLKKYKQNSLHKQNKAIAIQAGLDINNTQWLDSFTHKHRKTVDKTLFNIYKRGMYAVTMEPQAITAEYLKDIGRCALVVNPLNLQKLAILSALALSDLDIPIRFIAVCSRDMITENKLVNIMCFVAMKGWWHLEVSLSLVPCVGRESLLLAVRHLAKQKVKGIPHKGNVLIDCLDAHSFLEANNPSNVYKRSITNSYRDINLYTFIKNAPDAFPPFISI